MLIANNHTYQNNRYGSVERFANYAHEGNHARGKRHLMSTNALRHGSGSTAQQLLERSLRQEEHDFAGYIQRPKRKRAGSAWAVRNLQASNRLQKFVASEPENTTPSNKTGSVQTNAADLSTDWMASIFDELDADTLQSVYSDLSKEL